MPAALSDPETRPGVAAGVVLAAFLSACVYAASTTPSSNPQVAVVLVVITGAIVGLVLHEWAHALVAYRGGDYLVIEKGYLTMDVRHYSDPMLSIAIPTACVALGGLPIPGGAVWIETWLLRGRAWDSAVSAAGPAMSFAVGLAALGASEITSGYPVLASALAFLALLEVGLVLINLLPIPGLDGYGIIEPYLPTELQSALRPVKQHGVLILIALMIGTGAFTKIWSSALDVTTRLGADYGKITFAQLMMPR